MHSGDDDRYCVYSYVVTRGDNEVIRRRLQTKLGECAFSYSGPSAWNCLPVDFRPQPDASRFKKILQSHLFRIAFNVCR